MHRETDEVLASQREMLRRMARPGANVSDERLGELFRKQMVELEEWLAGQPNFQVIGVNYRACIESAADVARTVNHFLGGTWDEEKMAAVVDRALYRQRGLRN
jgi:hypothetical protein